MVGTAIFQLLDIIETSPAAPLDHLYSNMIKIFFSELEGEVESAPDIEDLLLLYLLTAVHAELPAFIRDKYFTKMGAADTRIHVFKSEILADAECFISGPELKSDMFTLQDNEFEYKEDIDQNLIVATKVEEILDGLDPLGEKDDVDHVKLQPQNYEDIEMKLENNCGWEQGECSVEEAVKCDNSMDSNIQIQAHNLNFQDAKGTVTNRKSQKRAGSKRSQTKSADPEINTDQAEKNKETILKCELCDYQNIKAVNLRLHVKRMHLKVRFKCDKCEFDASTGQLLRQHKESKHMGIKHFCDKCTKSFTKKTDLKYHIKHVHGNSGLQCEHCEFRCMFKSHMRMHIEKKHPEAGPKDKRFICDQCDYSTDIYGNINIHVKRVHGDHRHKCEYCDYQTEWLPNLTQHMECRHETKEFSCDQCDFTTRKPMEFKRHWKYRHDPNSKRIPCDKCHFSTTRADALKRHIEVVHEGKRAPCSHEGCDYIARRKGDLVKHIQTVHEKIRHKCEMCEFSCSDKFYLRRHVTAKHDTKHDPD